MKLSPAITLDFKEVDDNFKSIIKQIYQQQTKNLQKKEILHYFFDAYSELKNSSQGKSFYAFWEFLLSASLQKAWDMLTKNLFESLEGRQIDVHDRFLKDVKLHLFDAGQRVYKTNDRMAEKLSRIIRQHEQSEAEITRKIINDIKNSLIKVSNQKNSPEFGFKVEEIEIKLPLERTLTFNPVSETEYKDKPVDAQLSVNDLNRLEQLYNPYHVDRDVLRSRVEEVLKQKPQVTLGEVISASSGITKGLTEVFGYLSVLKEYHTVVSPEKTEDIVFDTENMKKIVVPEIIIIPK